MVQNLETARECLLKTVPFAICRPELFAANKLWLMGTSEVTQNRSVAICEENCVGASVGAGYQEQSWRPHRLAQPGQKANQTHSWKTQAADIWSKPSTSAAERGSDSHLDTKWPFRYLCKLRACWYQILSKRAKEKVALTLSEGHEQPLLLCRHLGIFALRRVMGSNAAASSAGSSRWRNHSPHQPGFVFCWLKLGSGIVQVWYWMNIECASKIKSLFRSSLKYWPWKKFPAANILFHHRVRDGAGLAKEMLLHSHLPPLPWGAAGPGLTPF